MEDAQRTHYTKAISTALTQSMIRVSADAVEYGVLDKAAFSTRMLAIMEDYKLSTFCKVPENFKQITQRERFKS